MLQLNTLPIWPKTHLTLLHHLGRSITIAWPKTAPHLDYPSSLYAYIYTLPPPKFAVHSSPNPKNSQIRAAGRFFPRRTCPRRPPRPTTACHVSAAVLSLLLHRARPAGPGSDPRSPIGRRRPSLPAATQIRRRPSLPPPPPPSLVAGADSRRLAASVAGSSPPRPETDGPVRIRTSGASSAPPRRQATAAASPLTSGAAALASWDPIGIEGDERLRLLPAWAKAPRPSIAGPASRSQRQASSPVAGAKAQRRLGLPGQLHPAQRAAPASA